MSYKLLAASLNLSHKIGGSVSIGGYINIHHIAACRQLCHTPIQRIIMRE